MKVVPYAQYIVITFIKLKYIIQYISLYLCKVHTYLVHRTLCVGTLHIFCCPRIYFIFGYIKTHNHILHNTVVTYLEDLEYSFDISYLIVLGTLFLSSS